MEFLGRISITVIKLVKNVNELTTKLCNYTYEQPEPNQKPKFSLPYLNLQMCLLRCFTIAVIVLVIDWLSINITSFLEIEVHTSVYETELYSLSGSAISIV